MFKIQVIKPSNSIILNFRSYKNESNRYVLEISDQKDRKTCIKFDSFGAESKITSTLFSRWLNFHLQRELKILAGKGSSFEIAKKGGDNPWHFRENVVFFGLHDILHKSGDICRVTIDDSIGMRNVVAIVKALGYNVETQFDTSTGRMVEIKLTKEEFV